jgi:hypothetical protein
LGEVIVTAAWLQSHGFPAPDGSKPTDKVVVTLVQYGAGNQRSFGFSNLALYPGPMMEMFASFFPT